MTEEIKETDNEREEFRKFLRKYYTKYYSLKFQAIIDYDLYDEFMESVDYHKLSAYIYNYPPCRFENFFIGFSKNGRLLSNVTVYRTLTIETYFTYNRFIYFIKQTTLLNYMCRTNICRADTIIKMIESGYSRPDFIEKCKITDRDDKKIGYYTYNALSLVIKYGEKEEYDNILKIINALIATGKSRADFGTWHNISNYDSKLDHYYLYTGIDNCENYNNDDDNNDGFYYKYYYQSNHYERLATTNGLAYRVALDKKYYNIAYIVACEVARLRRWPAVIACNL